MIRTNSTIRAVVFDLDDTLYPERDYVRSGYDAVARHLREARGTTEAYEQWLWQRFLCGQTAGALDALNDHFGLGLARDGIGRLIQVYREHVPQIGPFAGVGELLAGLHNAGGRRLGLVSDGFLPAQRLKLDAVGLAGCFDAVVFTEELGRDAWKPSPAGFEAVREKLGVPHSACAYVGDNPAKDFIAPNRLGWRTIRYVRPGQVHADEPTASGGAPQAVVRTDAELLVALR